MQKKTKEFGRAGVCVCVRAIVCFVIVLGYTRISLVERESKRKATISGMSHPFFDTYPFGIVRSLPNCLVDLWFPIETSPNKVLSLNKETHLLSALYALVLALLSCSETFRFGWSHLKPRELPKVISCWRRGGVPR